MSKKDNFGQAMYDIFGVGKDGSKDQENEIVVNDDSSEEVEQPQVTFPVEESQEKVVDMRVEKAVPITSYDSTYLAAGTMMKGTLNTKGDVEIAGDFEGEIISKGKVTLHSSVNSKVTAAGLVLLGCNLVGNVEITGDIIMDAQSYIEGDVTAENMTCSGKVKGDLDIQDNLTLDEFAQVDGNIKVDTLSVDRGAKISGGIEMRSLKK